MADQCFGLPMQFRVASHLLLVDDTEQAEAAQVALGALLRHFACPTTTFMTFWRLSMQHGPELRGWEMAPGQMGDGGEWSRGTLAVQEALRAEFPRRPSRMTMLEREKAVAAERVVLEVLKDDGSVLEHPLAHCTANPLAQAVSVPVRPTRRSRRR